MSNAPNAHVEGGGALQRGELTTVVSVVSTDAPENNLFVKSRYWIAPVVRHCLISHEADIQDFILTIKMHHANSSQQCDVAIRNNNADINNTKHE